MLKKKNNNRNCNQNQRTRVNERIRCRQVRVIGPDGGMLGVMHPKDAYAKAKEYGLDLVEISPNARPPVCKILEHGKFLYEQKKKKKTAKASATKQSKEVKFTPNIDTHDYDMKVSKIREFLTEGRSVSVCVEFRGRQMQYKQHGHELIKKISTELDGVGSHSKVTDAGRRVSTHFFPISS